MLASRYEFKFLVSPAVRDAVIAAAGEALRPDTHGDEGVYRVTSLYYDTRGLAAYREKIDGEARRRKFRLRFYPGRDNALDPAYLEIKHRIDNRIFKERVLLTPEGAADLLDGRRDLNEINACCADASPKALATRRAIHETAIRPGLEPTVVVTYLREAHEGIIDKRLRVTFDAACRALSPGQHKMPDSLAGRPLLEADRLVMEVKFDQALPRWMRDVVARLQVPLQRFSKYAAGIEALNRQD